MGDMRLYPDGSVEFSAGMLYYVLLVLEYKRMLDAITVRVPRVYPKVVPRTECVYCKQFYSSPVGTGDIEPCIGSDWLGTGWRDPAHRWERIEENE